MACEDRVGRQCIATVDMIELPEYDIPVRLLLTAKDWQERATVGYLGW